MVLKVFGQLDSAARGSYYRLAQMLEQRYGTRYQDIFRARFWIHTRRRDESLLELAQGLKGMLHAASPGANIDFITVMLPNQFIKALDSPQLKIQDQAKPLSLPEALARAMEFEFLVMSSLSISKGNSSSGFKKERIQLSRTIEKDYADNARWDTRRTIATREKTGTRKKPRKGSRCCR
ncbi:hypothetical protein E2C01_048705 [Portunus trituberculatus]|uniref:Uncharacterized protein n=1 Tax=Portunus trituberculatus TaxID=210409 RepID=A0A5B7GAW5_PORTR|nr:hypothetical protein [Portunus trituberculatus]